MKEKMQRAYQIMNRISVFLHLLLSVILNLTIETISRHSFVSAWKYMVQSPWTFLYNTYLIFITFLIVYLVRRRVFVRILIGVLWLVLGCVNGYMLSVRVTPFNAQDLKVLGDAFSLMDKYMNWIQVVLVIVAVVGVITGLVFLWRKAGKFAGKMYRRIPALIAVVVAFGTVGFLTSFAISQRVISNYFGNIAFAYQDYGLPYCFSASLLNTGMDKPPQYTEKKVTAIEKKSTLLNASFDMEEKPNIILVQLESFFDPYEVEFLKMSEDPIPYFRKLTKQYSTGYFKAPSVGAGTANTEFEVLTGMNLRYFGPGEYPYKTILKEEPVESVATALKNFGYGAHALHNNTGTFYSRSTVFANMGFDTFTSVEFMNVLEETENGWAQDDILTEHIMNAMDSTEQQDFVFGITVQGHGDYPEEPILDNPKIKVTGAGTEGKNYAWEYYVNQLYETDIFIKDLIKAIKKREEPTVLILYGDHLPTMGLEAGDLKNRYLYNTNYVIWDNIGLEKKDRNIPAYQLMAEVFTSMNIEAGTFFNYHQKRRQTKDYLEDLELLQYDVLYGEQYVYGGAEYSPALKSDMRMGVLDVTLSDIALQTDGSYYLYGENFTKSSVVFVDDKETDAIFQNNRMLVLGDVMLEEGTVIQVKQISDSAEKEVMATTGLYAYESGKLVWKEDAPPEESASTE